MLLPILDSTPIRSAYLKYCMKCNLGVAVKDCAHLHVPRCILVREGTPYRPSSGCLVGIHIFKYIFTKVGLCSAQPQGSRIHVYPFYLIALRQGEQTAINYLQANLIQTDYATWLWDCTYITSFPRTHVHIIFLFNPCLWKVWVCGHTHVIYLCYVPEI